MWLLDLCLIVGRGGEGEGGGGEGGGGEGN